MAYFKYIKIIKIVYFRWNFVAKISQRLKYYFN